MAIQKKQTKLTQPRQMETIKPSAKAIRAARENRELQRLKEAVKRNRK